MLGWNLAAAERTLAEVEVAAAAEVGAAAVVEAGAAEAGVATLEVAAAAAEAEVAGAAAAAEAAAPIPAFRVSCVCHREPFFCEQLAAQHHVSHWRHYSFAEMS